MWLSERNGSGRCLVYQEKLCLALVGGFDGGTPLNDGAYLELHAGHVGRGLQLAALQQAAVDLVAVLLGKAVLGIEADGRRGDVQPLAVGGDGDLRYDGSLMVSTL